MRILSKIYRFQYVCLLLFVFIISSAVSGQQITFEGLKSINGTALYCKVIGEGEPLVVLHGGPGLSHDYFLPHLLPLAKRFQLIFFDQRAQGQSSMTLDSSQISIQTMVDDIEGIRQAFGLKKIHLLAHSWGGLLAIHYAAQHSESLQSLILVDVVPLNTQQFQKEMQENIRAKTTRQDSLDRAKLMTSEGIKKGDVKVFEELMLLNFKSSAYNRANIRHLHLNLSPNFLESNRLLRYLGKDAFDYDLTGTAKRIGAPTLIIHGKSDLLPLASDLEIERTIPNASLRQLMKSGHFPFLEEQEKFNKIIRNWIKGHSNQ